MRHADGYPLPGRAAMTWDGTFDPGAFGPPGGTLELRNLGGVVTGRLGVAPVAAETLRVEAGRVASVGAAPAEADVVVDAAGAVAAPGLVDTHCHVVFGDYTRASTPSGSWRATCTAASPR
jgi:hypothetical protein